MRFGTHFEKWILGSQGDPPVPSGDRPDESEATMQAIGDGLFTTVLLAIPGGGPQTEAGKSLQYVF